MTTTSVTKGMLFIDDICFVLSDFTSPGQYITAIDYLGYRHFTVAISSEPPAQIQKLYHEKPLRSCRPLGEEAHENQLLL